MISCFVPRPEPERIPDGDGNRELSFRRDRCDHVPRFLSTARSLTDSYLQVKRKSKHLISILFSR